MFKLQKNLLAIALSAAPFFASVAKEQAAPITSPAKTYELVHLQQVVANSDKCGTIRRSLEVLAEKPFSMQFTPSAEIKQHDVNHVGNEAENHSNKIAKQTANGNKFQRTSMGALELKNEKIEYVMEISANLDNPSHQHLYPIILSGDSGQCYYTALIKPDRETVESFKKSIAAGVAAQGVDLHHQH